MKTKNIRPSNGRTLKPQRQNRRIADALLAPAPTSRLSVQSILVPIDFSVASTKALKYALPFARQFGAKVTLLYVVEPVATPDFAYYPLMMENEKVVAAGHKELDKLCTREAIDPRFIGKKLVRNGVPYREITEAAKSLKVDLIVISTHGNTGLKHLMLGSTTERVVRHAACPVLVVREHEQEFVSL